MNNKQLQKIFLKHTDSIQENSRLGYWKLSKGDLILIAITDIKANRMRIISPISTIDSLDKTQMLNALTANFHTALDVKYAISDNIMWSVFTHPLNELSDNQVINALSQVYKSALTFGFTYSSTDLIFPNK